MSAGDERASGTVRSDRDLRAISVHVLYEIQMFASTTHMLAEHIWDGIDGDYLKRTAHNGLLEAFTVHTRSLMDFLYESPKRADDVSALDFFTPNEWARIDAEERKDRDADAFFGTELRYRSFRSNRDNPALLAARRRVGKEIAHLTYKRLEPEVEGRLWPHQDIVEALALDLHRFADQVPTDRVDDSFRAGALMAVMALCPAEATAARHEPGVTLPVATSSLPNA